MTALSNRVHMFARPNVKDQLMTFFTVVLGCELAFSSDSANAPGQTAPILAFVFPGGGVLSVDFTEDALDEEHARRGLWIELQAEDAPALQRRVLAAGLPRVSYPGNDHFYFAAPGGQVMRIVAARKP